ncbi:DUF6614 family protein [Vannielia litorea]|uniref:DUF6614 family protein n=1 Tax=Vannielia litorea TaxID=1217970 RepID=UPI0021BDB5AE|nr:DUF6614 family protein [Vannielia litorea]
MVLPHHAGDRALILYHCMIELKQGSRALGFATATEAWMTWLLANGHIGSYRLVRRKVGLASGRHTDFLLDIEIPSLRALDTALSSLTEKGPDAERLYEQMHQMIASIDVGLYRPYPDPTQRETIALV